MRYPPLLSPWIPGCLLAAVLGLRCPPAGGLELHGSSLSAALNAGATLGEGTLALSVDPDGPSPQPSTRLLVPDTALERFALSFSAGQASYSLTNIAPPGVTQAPLAISDVSSSPEKAAEASLTLGPLRLRQRVSFDAEGSSLRLSVTLSNLGSYPLTNIRYLRAANPAPDADRYGTDATLDQLLVSPEGELALATGPVSGLGLGLAVLDAPANLGFCFACTSPDSQAYDPDGRLEDWDLLAVVLPDPVASGKSVTFTLIYLAGITEENAFQALSLERDSDGDGFTGAEGDCDDLRVDTYPGATESCEGTDQDCDGAVDEGTLCADDDGDGYSELQGDCQDGDARVHPLALEGKSDGENGLVADGKDNDCDGFTDEGTTAVDDDGDGFSELEGDCEDGDAGFSPGVAEVPYDGLDQDCDGLDVTDVDGDGAAGGPDGADCDDQDASRYPGALEVEDARDQDCDGLADEPFLFPGRLRVSEVLYDPLAVPDRQGEYLELYNPGPGPLELSGWKLTLLSGQTHVLDASLGQTLVPAGGYLLLAVLDDQALNGGLEADGPCSLTLPNTSDSLAVLAGELLVDTFSWGGTAPDPVGASLQRDPACLAEVAESAACVCAAPAAWGEGSDRGSPGEENAPCPPLSEQDGDGDGILGLEWGGTDCDDGDGQVYPGAFEIPYDQIDQDCDGVDLTDQDADGYAAEAAGGDDCNDENPNQNPGMQEDGPEPPTPDGLDNDCDGATDEDTTAWDDDGDGYTELEGDCDDGATGTHPAAEEAADGQDNDCDGKVDEGTARGDDDGDGFTEEDGDCDDGDSGVYPGADEVADGRDQDCDGEVDEGLEGEDGDGDGYSLAEGDCQDGNASIYPGAAEACEDGLDQDCDGEVDEDCSPGCSCSAGTSGSGDLPRQEVSALWLGVAAAWTAYRCRARTPASKAG